MKILIIGANGYIGSNLIKKIKKFKKNIEITALVNGPDFYGIQNYNDISFAVYDFREDISNFVNNSYDVIVNLAWTGVNGPEKKNVLAQKKNVLFTKSLLAAAKKHNINKIIFSGTITENFHKQYIKSQDNNPAITYGYFKNKAKDICKKHNKSLNIIWFQFANVYGGNNLSGNILSRIINCINNKQSIELSNGEQYYDFIHIDDLTTAILNSLDKSISGFNEFYLGSGNPRFLKEFITEIGNIYKANDLLLLGKREDDGLLFKKSWMNNKKSITFLGNYVQKSFSERIKDEKQEKLIKHMKPINIYNAFLCDAKFIFPFIQNDERGYFVKDFQQSTINIPQRENFYTFSKKNVIRGMHYQATDEQGKIVSCISGTILDVIIDLRITSKTFLQKQYCVLSDKNHIAIYIPPGFAHGFLALTDSIVFYRCNKEFNPKSDLGFNVFDKKANIKWDKPLSNFSLSQKDISLNSLEELLKIIR